MTHLIIEKDIFDFLETHTHPAKGYELIFLDPPFNLKKNYGVGISDEIDDYESWYKTIIQKVITLLAEGGSLFVYNTPSNNLMITDLLRKDLIFRNWITVEMKNSLPIKGRLYPSNYSLLYFTKGKPQIFGPPRIPVKTCRHCSKDIPDYGGHKNKLNPLGLNLSDVWTDISPVRHSKNKNRFANELPVRLIYRILSMATVEGSNVLDLFSGSGVLTSICGLMGRDCTSNDISTVAVLERLQDDSRDKELLAKEIEYHNRLYVDKK